jgi:hypothetical protein
MTLIGDYRGNVLPYLHVSVAVNGIIYHPIRYRGTTEGNVSRGSAVLPFGKLTSLATPEGFHRAIVSFDKPNMTDKIFRATVTAIKP